MPCYKNKGFPCLSQTLIRPLSSTMRSGQRPLPKETCMPRFLIERNFAEQLNPLTRDGVAAVTQVNADVGVQWLFSFLSADKKKTYCLYEAPSAEAIREAARRLNIPADVIVELSGEVRPEQFA